MRRAIFLGLLLLSQLAAAAVPSSFTVQGVLRDGQGQLMTMPVNVTVILWDAQTGGNKLASYGPMSQAANNGLFTWTIQDPNLATELANAPAVFVEVTAGNDTFPRQPVTSDIYAIFAARADMANDLSCAGCVSNAEISDVDASKVNGKVAACAQADSVVNGVLTTGSYANPSWLSSLDGTKITGQVASAASAASADALSTVCAQNQCVADADISQVSASKVNGKVAACANADTVTNGVVTTGSYNNPAWLTGLAGTKISGPVASATAATSATTATNFTGALAGDVTGTQGATVVGRLQGKAVATTAPADGQVLKYSASNGSWGPGDDANAGGTVTNVTSTSAALTVANGTTTPTLTVNGAQITGINGANITAGSVPKTALAPGSLTSSVPFSMARHGFNTSLASGGFVWWSTVCNVGEYPMSGDCDFAGGSGYISNIFTNDHTPAANGNQLVSGGGFTFGVHNTGSGSMSLTCYVNCLSFGTIKMP